MLLDWMSVALDTTLMISWAAGHDARKVVKVGVAGDRRAASAATGTTAGTQPAQ